MLNLIFRQKRTEYNELLLRAFLWEVKNGTASEEHVDIFIKFATESDEVEFTSTSLFLAAIRDEETRNL